jgi:hypothetical protein
MYCYECARKLDDGEFFCRKCGAETVFSTTAKESAGYLAIGGHFALGVFAYALLFLAAVALVTLFFPQAGSPQLAMLMLVILGAFAAGVAGALTARTRPRGVKKVHDTAAARSNAALPETGPLQLPEQRSAPVPPSVVESTTNKLHVR